MAMYARLDSNDLFTGELASFELAPLTKGELAPGKSYWVPARKFTTDNSTIAHTVAEPQPPVVDLGVPEVYQETIIRDMTAQEIADEATQLVDSWLTKHPDTAAMGMVLADLLMETITPKPTVQEARQMVRDRLETYYVEVTS
jgi:hypothetical protein